MDGHDRRFCRHSAEPYGSELGRGIARLAVLTGISVQELEGLEVDQLLELSDAATERYEWTTVEELLAQQNELIHSLLRITMKASGAKQHDLPRPLKIDRPRDKRDKKRNSTREERSAFFSAGRAD